MAFSKFSIFRRKLLTGGSLNEQMINKAEISINNKMLNYLLAAFNFSYFFLLSSQHDNAPQSWASTKTHSRAISSGADSSRRRNNEVGRNQPGIANLPRKPSHVHCRRIKGLYEYGNRSNSLGDKASSDYQPKKRQRHDPVPKREVIRA